MASSTGADPSDESTDRPSLHREYSDSLAQPVTHEEQDSISPLILGRNKDVDELNLDGTRRHHSAPKYTKRLVGRSSFSSTKPQGVPPSPGRLTRGGISSGAAVELHPGESVWEEITAWIDKEKQRRRSHRRKRATKFFRKLGLHSSSGEEHHHHHHHRASSSSSSDGSDAHALDKLRHIVEKGRAYAHVGHEPHERRGSVEERRRPTSLTLPSRKPRQTNASTASDSDSIDTDLHVPNADVVLDNSKTMLTRSRSNSYALGMNPGMAPPATSDAWAAFKFEIVRLAHTLGLKGWRQVPMEQSEEISVDRISGALTNAVYVVSPPTTEPTQGRSEDIESVRAAKRSRPIKLLLRIYGPQVEHLINREVELQILGRLAKKSIGPRVLGTFTNGRFEQFLPAHALKPTDLRDPTTSKQIAKRMRELHDGIDLLDSEREAGPFVWQSWDKWVERAERIAGFLESHATYPPARKYAKWGLVCGTTWAMFRQTVEKYRRLLDAQMLDQGDPKQSLVFAHNDTQYGNILRLDPPGESPLLLPANQHKQLIVIDFEYANANPRGMEFANHFTEWCYDYHDPDYSYACNTRKYPRPDEQARFIRAYLEHQPEVVASTAAVLNTPRQGPLTTRGSYSSSIAGLRHDSSVSMLSLTESKTRSGSSAPANAASTARPPSSILEESALVSEPEENDTVNGDANGDHVAVESANDEWLADELHRLLAETRLWRPANSAYWTVWGIMQARVPEFYAREAAMAVAASGAVNGGSSDSEPNGYDALGVEEDEDDVEESEFDYLSYARDRAMLFWGDCILLGLVKPEDLPDEVQKLAKRVDY